MSRQGFTMLAAAVLLMGAAIHGQAQEKRSSVGSDIVIAKGTTAEDVSCVFCSVYVHGEVTGKVAVVMGDVVVDGTVDDKVALVMGELKVLPGGTIHGNVAIAAGGLTNQGTVNGDIKQSGGRHSAHHIVVIGLFIAMLPFLVLGLIIWLIVRAVRRPKYPMYPPGPPPPGYPPAPVR